MWDIDVRFLLLPALQPDATSAVSAQKKRDKMLLKAAENERKYVIFKFLLCWLSFALVYVQKKKMFNHRRRLKDGFLF